MVAMLRLRRSSASLHSGSALHDIVMGADFETAPVVVGIKSVGNFYDASGPGHFLSQAQWQVTWTVDQLQCGSSEGWNPAICEWEGMDAGGA